MNRILVIVVLILLPITIVSYDNSDDVSVMKLESLEERLEFANIENLIEKDSVVPQVLVSSNRDKSNAYSLDLEDYIIGVVAGEMPASFHMEALKAQAVASRTYALYKMKNIANYVLSTTVNDQVYLTVEQMKYKWGSDFDYYYRRIKEAVDETSGQILTYQDEIAITYYFAISNGYTDNGSTVFNDNKAYLVSVDSSWDKNYGYASQFVMNQSTFCNLLGISCNGVLVSNVVRADNHYVRTITINNKTFSGIQVFHLLNLKSHDFEIIPIDSGILIKTYGFGHGVGMSQYGAQGMASSGKNYEEILTHYYQNTHLSQI